MFDIKPRGNMDTGEKLLYNVWQELKELNANLKEIASKDEVECKIEPKVEVEEVKYKCGKCGIEFDSNGKLLAHYKTHKKEERENNAQSNTKGKREKGNTN